MELLETIQNFVKDFEIVYTYFEVEIYYDKETKNFYKVADEDTLSIKEITPKSADYNHYNYLLQIKDDFLEDLQREQREQM